MKGPNVEPREVRRLLLGHYEMRAMKSGLNDLRAAHLAHAPRPADNCGMLVVAPPIAPVMISGHNACID